MQQDTTPDNSDMGSFPVPHKIDTDNGMKWMVNSYLFFQWLGIRSYSTWCKDEILTMGESGVDFIFVVSNLKNTRGRPRNEYLLTTDFAKHIALSSRTDRGKQYRQYLIDFEERALKTQGLPPIKTEAAAIFYAEYLKQMSAYSKTAYLTLGAKVSKEVFGIEVPQHFLPEVDEPRWSATEIATDIAKSPQAVGKAAGILGLKKAPFGIERLSIAKNATKEISMWYYNNDARTKIVEHFHGSNSLFSSPSF